MCANKSYVEMDKTVEQSVVPEPLGGMDLVPADIVAISRVIQATHIPVKV
jgi:hypothetical protein